MKAGASSVAAGLLITTTGNARVGRRAAGVDRCVVETDRSARTSGVAATARRRAEGLTTRAALGTTFTMGRPHHAAVAATAPAVTRSVWNAFGQTGIEGRAAIGFDGSRCVPAGAERREARVDSGVRRLRVALCGDQRRRLGRDVDERVDSTGSEDGQSPTRWNGA